MEAKDKFNYKYKKGISVLLDCLSDDYVGSLEEYTTVSIRTNESEHKFANKEIALNFLKDKDLLKIQSVEILTFSSVYSYFDTKDIDRFTLNFESDIVERDMEFYAEQPVL